MNNQRMIMPSGGLRTQHITVNGKPKQEIESSGPEIVETFKFYKFFTTFKQKEWKRFFTVIIIVVFSLGIFIGASLTIQSFAFWLGYAALLYLALFFGFDEFFCGGRFADRIKKYRQVTNSD